ncbi:Pol protein [Wolbachia endosymbiont of Drosophila ananassae]|nr:Pol protein [Wolbachia endosymbiont of Drosophila ananassae]
MWGNARSCNRGKLLAEAVQAKNRYNILATGEATCYPFNKKANPSAIDFAVYSGFLPTHISISSVSELSSDHVPLIINAALGKTPLISPDVEQAAPRPPPLPRGSHRIKAFRDHLEKYILLNTEINSGEDIDDCVGILLKNIENAALHATPIANNASRYSTTHPSRHMTKLDKPASILFQLLQACFSKMKEDPSPENKAKFSRIRNKFKKAIKRLKQAQVNRMLLNLDPEDRYNMAKIWKITRHIKSQPQSDHPLKIPVQSRSSGHSPASSDHIWTRSSKEKADAFVKYLEDRFSPKMTTLEQERIAIINDLNDFYAHSPSPPSAPIFFRLEELQTQIAALATAKSPGEDQIQNALIKLLPKKAVLYLLHIYNSVLRLGHFPHQWKLAVITMIHKTGKPTHCPDSYRPISLLSGFGKLFERLLLSKLFKCKNFAEAIPDHPEHTPRTQFGTASVEGHATHPESI